MMAGPVSVSTADPADAGNISIRVVVLPRKLEEQDSPSEIEDDPIDLVADEMLAESGASPIASYLERPKTGKLCVVFLVNGQRHDGLDNSFIVQQLGFKYLRKRMMIIIDVDGLRPEALGELIQGSRQGFYKGRVWEAIFGRVVATLKGDPDLQKLEEDAEAEVAELQAGDQKVKEALDTLIDAHHHYADHAIAGKGGEVGLEQAESALGAATPVPESLVSLLSPEHGQAADYPVLAVIPEASSCTLRPGIDRVLTVTSHPSSAWSALASLTSTVDPKVPELHVAEDRAAKSAAIRLLFDPPKDFDPSDYPVRTTLRFLARFNGQKEVRQLAIALTIKPHTPPPEPELLDEPTVLKVSTRQPVRLWLGSTDTHVRVRWNGKDDLTLGPSPRWVLKGGCVSTGRTGIATIFSQPRKGRFSLLVALPPDATVGEELRFEIIAAGPHGVSLTAAFDAVVSERPEPLQPEPRLISGFVPGGASRRPPYALRYITKDQWENGTCFGGENWGASDAAAYQEPTDKQPLTLLINQDMDSLEAFRKHLTARKLTENEVKSRLLKYTSHVAFHLYQMYQSAQSLVVTDDDESYRPPTPNEQRAEIHRVAMTLLKLMQVSR